MHKVSQKIKIHPFEEKILQLYDLATKEMFAKNYKLFERYDMAMIGDTIATSRYHQLAIIVNLTRQINKDWDLVTRRHHTTQNTSDYAESLSKCL